MSDQQNSDASNDVNGSNGIGGEGRAAAAAALAEKTLTGDLRDFILQRFRDERNPWYLMSEQHQTLLAKHIELYCEGLVSRVVHIIAAHDFPVIGVALDQVNFKPKGVEAKMTFGLMGAKTKHALVDAQGGGIVIVVADEALYRGSRGLARVDKQAPELPLDATQPNGQSPDPGHDADEDGHDAREGRDPGETDGTDTGAEPPVVHLDDAGNPAAGYTLGYEDGRAGRNFAPAPFEAGSVGLANYQAGWLQAQIDGLNENPRAQQKATANSADHFRELGRAAFARGAVLAYSPLASWIPATKWWREGLLEAICRAGGDAGRAGVDRAANPYAEGTIEGNAWLSAWTEPAPGDGNPAAPQEQQGRRRRGRPRKGSEPPTQQPGM